MLHNCKSPICHSYNHLQPLTYSKLAQKTSNHVHARCTAHVFGDLVRVFACEASAMARTVGTLRPYQIRVS